MPVNALSAGMLHHEQRSFRIRSGSPRQTEWLARRISRLCGNAGALLLSGEIGSGKTVFARAFIRTRLSEHGIEDEIPSPTYTLVQTYHAGSAEIWHVDLYRLTSHLETVELGLDDAIDRALCLIEWPERLGKTGFAEGHSISFRAEASDEYARVIAIATRHRKLADFLSSLDGEIPPKPAGTC